METRASYVLVGSFVLALTAAAAIFVIWLARAEFAREPARYVIYVSGSVTGLQVGSPVRYRGVPVGSVSQIAIEPEHIERIKVVIEVAEGTPITEDTVATLALQGITGVAFIQLTGGTQASPVLTAETPDTLPEIPHRTSGLEQVVEKAPELLSKAVLVADRLSQFVDDDNLRAVRATLKNLEHITGVLAERRIELDRLLVNADSAFKEVRVAARDVSALTNQLSTGIEPITSGADDAMKDLQGTLKAARQTLQSFNGVSNQLERLVAENRTPLRDFSSVGLYELSLFVAEARVLVANLTRLTAQIERDPAGFFFGDTQRGFEVK